MKYRYAILITLTIIVLLLLSVSGYHHYYCSYPAQEPYRITIHRSDTLEVTYIGDSWAFLHQQYDEQTSCLLSEMANRPVRFRSYGICGLTSSEIYEQFYVDDHLKDFLSAGSDVCIVSAGINDTYKKMPPQYYVQSMKNIIHFLLFNHIYPILQEIPDYDIEKCYHRQTMSKKILRQVSMLISQTPLDCKQMFREALDTLIQRENMGAAISILRYKDWNSHYQEDLQQLYMSDGLHLNSSGYAVLDSCISQELLKTRFLQQKSQK